MQIDLAALFLCVLVVGRCADGEIIKDPASCGRTKCDVPTERKFKYEAGVTYRYEYSVNVSTNLGEQEGAGNGRNESKLFVDAVASLHFSNPCEGYLRLGSASVGHNRSLYNAEFPDRAGAEFKAAVERHELRFAFHDGAIHEVCAHPKDPTWAVNLKRGVLSMFQNTMKRFDVDRRTDELDVGGICDTRYTLHEAKKTSLVIRKTKDMASCTHRYKHLSVVQSNSYRSFLSPRRPIHKLLLDSRSECEITIDHNIYEEVACRDNHLLQPFSNGRGAGAQTEAVSRLRLLEEAAETFDEFLEAERDEETEELSWIPGKRSSLLYDHADTPKPTHGELRTTRNLLKDMCRLGISEGELQQRFSEMFTKFVHSARLLSYPSLSQLYVRANIICKSGRKHILNALPYIGSNAAVYVMKDLIIKKQVTRDKISDWVMTFALIPRPDRDTLWALSPLLEVQHTIPEAQFSLGYSSVVHTFCAASRDRDCVHLEPIVRFITDVRKKIEQGCAPRSHTPLINKQTVEALKAVGNMGLETEPLLKVLKSCIDDPGGFLPMEVRVAAIEAHRRLPSCEATRDSFFLDYYRNSTLHTEVRVASYLQVMRCPDYNVVKTIKQTLKAEEVNQVGSFVWSHLTNLLSSSSPTRVEIQSLLTDRDLGTKFNSDARKFSRNYESSFFSDEYNVGANYQSNVVFSPQSYVPRTVTFNVTLDVFGESVNAFEVGVRTEGLEIYAEKLFGPNGPFGSEKIGEHFSQFLRRFRSAPEEGDDYLKRVKRLPNVIDNNYDHPRISYGYKIFGNELRYVTLDGDREIGGALASFDPRSKVMQILSGREIHYENTTMFLDSTYVVPTVVGLPLRLGLSGSAAWHFKLSGSFDAKTYETDGAIEVLGNVMPSISVDVSGTMMVDAFYKSTGIKLRSNLYSSGAVQSHLSVKGYRLVRLSLGLPNKKMEVFSVVTDILLVTSNGADFEEKAIGVLITDLAQGNGRRALGSTISNTSCSWSSLDRLIGLKLCTDYQFPNVTKNPNASYFIFNGPTLFRVSLTKADATAKSYVFEYKWNVTQNESIVKLAFDTPGSQINRELSAIFSLNVKNRNVTLLLKSAGNLLIAKGTYKRSDDEVMIDLGLDVNGTRHVDAIIGYNRKNGNYGFVYSPRLYLAINSERVMELSGVIRQAQKNNVSQCEIDLIFETKKVWSRALGYVMRRNLSLNGSVQVEYQIEGITAPSKKDTLQLEVSLINRSSQTLTHKAANLKLQSSAYPQLNVEVDSWYQQAFGHLELHAEVNSSPHLQDDRHKLTAQFVVTYSKTFFQNQGAKVSAFVALTKPIQKLDIKVEVNHFSTMVESKTDLLIRYAPTKEIVLVVHIGMPRGTLLVLEGHANLTIPNFNSMLLDARINEKASREYELDFAGTWFSGHNATARGTYSDRSTLVRTNHGLKMLLKSPSFAKDVLINCKLYHDAGDLKIDLYMEHLDSDKYAFVLQHTTVSLSRFVTYVESRYKSSLYSVTTMVDTSRELRMEMHLDRWRDVHLIARGITEETKKEFGLEVKWDANRDPALKFASVVQLFKYDNPEAVDRSKNVSAVLTVTYPGRLIRGTCLFAKRGRNNYITDVRLDWSADKTVQFTVDADYTIDSREKSVKLESQLLTPFENWKRTAFNARYLRNARSLSAGSSVYWQDSHRILADFSASLAEDEASKSVEWSGNCGFVSSVHAVASLTANLTHKQLPGKGMDTRLTVRYHPDRVINARSSWRVDRGATEESFNLTGTLCLESPLANYRRADMKCHLHATPGMKFTGAMDLDIDKRKYTARLLGDLARLKESMIQFNATTPLERFSFLRGRFGLSASNRHLVAEVLSPTGPLGFEGICQIFGSNADFHVKLLVATPIDILQKALLVVKSNKREADFRLAYNNMTAGFQGVWHYRNLTDFHYSYILLTPLQGLQECGVVAKLIVAEQEEWGMLDVETEFSVRLSEAKIGVKAKGGPKPPPVRIPDEMRAPHEEEKVEEKMDEYSEEDEEDEDNFYWRGDFEVDLAIVPTVVGAVDVDKEGYVHKVLGVVRLPMGEITLDDRFFMEDFFHMRNELAIDTPFSCTPTITSDYVLALDLDNSMYIVELDVKVGSASSWSETGFSANYTYQGGEVDDSKTHTIKLNLKTPSSIMRFVNTTTVVEIDENVYKASLGILANDCLVDLTGSLELEDGYLDTAATVKINSPMLTLPRTRIIAKKDLTEKERRVEFALTIEEPILKTSKVQLSWRIEGRDFAKASITVETWLEALKSVSADFLYANTIPKDGLSKLNVNLKHYPEQEYKFIGDLSNNTITIDVHTPIANQEHFQFTGVLEKIREGLYSVAGNVTNQRTSANYQVTGSVAMQENKLVSAETTITPKTTGSGDRMILRIKREKYGFVLTAENRYLNGSLGINYINQFNWDYRLKLMTRVASETKSYLFSTFMNVQVDGNTTIYVKGETPWRDLESFAVKGNLLLANDSGDVRVDHQLIEDSSHVRLIWKLAYLENMFARIVGGYRLGGAIGKRKEFDGGVFFKSPMRALRNIDSGFDVNIDRDRWHFGTNVSLGFRDTGNVDVVLAVKTPPPVKDDHQILLSYHTEKTKGVDTDDRFNINYVVGYNAKKSGSNYASDGSLLRNARNLDAHLRLTWGKLSSQTLNNLVNVTMDSKKIDLRYAIYTPKFLREETAVVSFGYDVSPRTHSVIDANVFIPASTRQGSARIYYASLANVNGTVNASTPFPNLTHVGCNFELFTTLKRNKRFIEIFWPDHSALLNSSYEYESYRLDSSLKGQLLLEVLLNTRHTGHLTYGYDKRPQVTTGYSDLTYNDRKIVKSRYDSKSESRAGFDRDTIQITIENDFKPLKILYVDQFVYSEANFGTNYPTVEFKQVNVYQLGNKTAFSVAGEARVRTTHTGQDYQLKAVHLNRTVELHADYEVLSGEFDHNAKLSLAADAWVAYKLNIVNKTTEDVENQFVVMNLAYPRRNFTLNGSYAIIANKQLQSEAKLEWDRDTEGREPRSLSTFFNWTNATSAGTLCDQVVSLGFRHPSFRKNVSFAGYLVKRDERDLANARLIVDYSPNEEKLLTLAGELRDDSDLPRYRRYLYSIIGKHSATKLDLNAKGSIYTDLPYFAETQNRASYQRSFLPKENGQLRGRFNARDYEIEFHRENNELLKYLKLNYYAEHPKYVFNGTLIDTPNVNTTGAFYLNAREKLTWLMVNFTPDATESLRMYGKIPDARNAHFDIWRTYDNDLVVSDVSFYLRLNHSRLVTSTLRWRPELRQDVVSTVKTAISDLYDGMGRDADYWKQYIKSETVNCITDIWEDAQEDVKLFVDDWNNLTEIQTDLEDLKTYLNDSYNANEFYIKDIVAVGGYIIDELSLRSHIESLPNIINEIWEIMGESGEAIRNSLLWVLETIKNGYNKISEIVSAMLKGDSISQIAGIVESLVEKYDMFVKDLHVSFSRYVEHLWEKLSLTASQQWNKLLKLIEPIFVRFIHYLETVMWKAGKEVLDFLYDRRNEMMTSPYFDRFTKFTQDIDKVYRDVKANDIITNVQKYSSLLIRFLKERYFNIVPFGKELKDVVDEILSELKELKKLPSVSYVLDKSQQLYAKARYLYEYFDVQAKIESTVRLVHSKLMDIHQTALQAENRYREAKTKFIFDPQQGLMCFEQKLPVSWHAFNQTPEFQEIPEYRAIVDMGSYFVASNTTFWSLYYQYKPYTEPSNWLPPFKAQAMIAGARHYLTFDGRYFEFAGSCTYLLAKDFVRDHFAVLIKYADSGSGNVTTHRIIVLIEGQAIELDVFADTVRFVDSTVNLQLPIEFNNGSAFVYQEDSIVTIERKNRQFKLQCNLKFDVCTLELSGWYFGKTAGLLGTMDNEQSDDFLGSDGDVQRDVGQFAQSWSLEGDSCPPRVPTPDSDNDDESVDFCTELFANKSSEFSPCYSAVNPADYARMCLASANVTGACTVAMAYMQSCTFRDTYLRIPDKCTTCRLVNGTEVPEGEFRKLADRQVPRSTDVVFIVEAKPCNGRLRASLQSIEYLVTQLGKELNDRGLTDNRWSLVIFGGDGVYDRPRSLLLDSQIFTEDVSRFADYFGHIPVGRGNEDVFAAIGFASKLVFRAGVSKTFILMPCSHCDSQNQNLDYSVLHQVLLEHGVTLHILMDGDFQFEKERLRKMFYGLDATRSYTRKDAKKLTGDVDLRRQVKLSKSALGYCTPLSLETNGTIFSGDKLRLEKLPSIKKFVSVFAKRVALTAVPSPCQHCECTADNDGVTQMECMPCVYPTPVSVDYETFNEDDALSILQPSDDDYSQIDIDEE